MLNKLGLFYKHKDNYLVKVINMKKKLELLAKELMTYNNCTHAKVEYDGLEYNLIVEFEGKSYIRETFNSQEKLLKRLKEIKSDLDDEDLLYYNLD